MKTYRIVFGALAVIPLGLLTYHLFFEPLTYDPNSISTMAFLIFGIPILIFNCWAWFFPQIIEFYFFSTEKSK